MRRLPVNPESLARDATPAAESAPGVSDGGALGAPVKGAQAKEAKAAGVESSATSGPVERRRSPDFRRRGRQPKPQPRPLPVNPDSSRRELTPEELARNSASIEALVAQAPEADRDALRALYQDGDLIEEGIAHADSPFAYDPLRSAEPPVNDAPRGGPAAGRLQVNPESRGAAKDEPIANTAAPSSSSAPKA